MNRRRFDNAWVGLYLGFLLGDASVLAGMDKVTVSDIVVDSVFLAGALALSWRQARKAEEQGAK